MRGAQAQALLLLLLLLLLVLWLLARQWAGMAAMPVGQQLLRPPLPLFFLACLLGPLPLQRLLQLLPTLQPAPSLLRCPRMQLHSPSQPSALAPARWLLFTACLSAARGGCSPASHPSHLPLQLPQLQAQWMAQPFPTHFCSACEPLQLRPRGQTVLQLLLLLLHH